MKFLVFVVVVALASGYRAAQEDLVLLCLLAEGSLILGGKP